MEIDKSIENYLTGKELSNGMRFQVGISPVISRNELLANLVKGKSAIHIGCADHIDLIRKKRESGCYLHDILSDNASRLIGIDTNSSALSEMRSANISDLYLPNEFPKEDHFDLILIPDVIEHLPDVSSFLREMRSYNVEKFIFTTPNAFRIKNRFQFSCELANTDHRYWFSPYTLSKTLYASGFIIEKFFYTDSLSSYRNPLRNTLIRRFPLCRDGLAVVALKSNGDLGI